MAGGEFEASPGADSSDRPFYHPTAAQEFVAECSAESGVSAIPFGEVVYLPDDDRYEEAAKLKAGARTRRGEIESFTGISDPYKEPQNAEIALKTVGSLRKRTPGEFCWS
ncbi:MAG TPA: adenylyl-sulfate kinase [Pyrinomonadaceae bacterium]|nr:adenylyl-sulfate kinase [Pyrinomonadaceae bacterium]